MSETLVLKFRGKFMSRLLLMKYRFLLGFDKGLHPYKLDPNWWGASVQAEVERLAGEYLDKGHVVIQGPAEIAGLLTVVSGSMTMRDVTFLGEPLIPQPVVYDITILKLPDGTVTHKMCCICFEMIPVEELYVDSDGVKWDMCKHDGHAEKFIERQTERERIIDARAKELELAMPDMYPVGYARHVAEFQILEELGPLQ